MREETEKERDWLNDVIVVLEEKLKLKNKYERQEGRSMKIKNRDTKKREDWMRNGTIKVFVLVA